MIRLHQFPRFFGLPNASLFCMKVETWLRMAGLEYENVWVGNPAMLPKGKAPVIEHEGRTIPDSTFILRYLHERFSPDLDRHLDAHERAAAHAFARMLEERSYWVLVYSRWLDERGWPHVKRHFFGDIPPVIRDAVAAVMRRRVRGQLRGHGIGLHGGDEIYALGTADVDAVAAWLGDREFFMGDRPSGVDATVYAFAANAVHTLENPLAEAARRHANLTAYCERMRTRWFPELPSP